MSVSKHVCMSVSTSECVHVCVCVAGGGQEGNSNPACWGAGLRSTVELVIPLGHVLVVQTQRPVYLRCFIRPSCNVTLFL